MLCASVFYRAVTREFSTDAALTMRRRVRANLRPLAVNICDPDQGHLYSRKDTTAQIVPASMPPDDVAL